VDGLIATVASLAGVDVSLVSATVTASSVRISFSVQAASSGAQQSVSQALTSSLGTREAAQAAFGSALTVEQSPIISVISQSECTPSTLTGSDLGVPSGYRCMYVVGPKYELHWRTTPTVTYMAAVGQTDGYVGLGFSPSGGAMVGSEAVIGWLPGSGAGSVAAYELSSLLISGVVRTTAFGVGVTTTTYADGATTIHFVIDHANAPAAFSPATTTSFIWAIGSTDSLSYHTERGAFDLAIASGEAHVSAPSVDAYKWQLIHGLLMGWSWGVLLPIGVLIARYRKELLPHGQPKLWYRIHRNTQSTGIAMAIAGLAIALSRPEFGLIDTAHGYIGLAVMAMGLAQPINAMLRPHPAKGGESKSRARLAWEWLHKGSGYLALTLAVATSFLGIWQLSALAMRSMAIGYVVYGGLLALPLVLVIVLRMKWCPSMTSAVVCPPPV